MSAPENEQAAVRTTIVGGRPPGSGRSTGAVPRGIEVLVKKAAVDSEFRELLLEQRGRAAAAIGLELDPAEAAMLSAIPREQLAQIVDQTDVPAEQPKGFLGRVAAAVRAALGLGGDRPRSPKGDLADERAEIVGHGFRLDRPALYVKGIRPDRPPNAPTNKPEAGSLDPHERTLGIRPDQP